MSIPSQNKPMSVKKRHGNLEPLNIDKIHRMCEWGLEDLPGTSVSELAMAAHLQFVDEMETKDIHSTLVKACADLISEDKPNYQYGAARIRMFSLRKEVHGQYSPPDLTTYVSKMIRQGLYDAALTIDYSLEELSALDKELEHDRDLLFTHVALNQMIGKYLVKNRVTQSLHETPQFLYMGVAMALHSKIEDKEERMRRVIRFYHAASKQLISLPSPIMNGARTPTRQFSSCVLIEMGDSLDSINSTASAVVKYISQRAGIGINAGALRSLGSPIRGGEGFHTGVVPFYRHMQTAVKSCSQGAMRGGAATLFYPIWAGEAESLLVLKNNRGTEVNRVRHLDYGIQFNGLMYERLINNGKISLFSTSDVPDLLEAMSSDQGLFRTLYERYENDATIPRKEVSAVEHFTMFMSERAETGRIYLQNLDHCNVYGPFDEKVAPVKQSNLCVTGDTLVDVMLDGVATVVEMKDIANKLAEHDEVLAKSMALDSRGGNAVSYEPITAFAFMNNKAKVLRITDVASGRFVECTPDHEVWTSNRGYVKAGELRTDDELVLDTVAQYKSPITIVELDKEVPVYDITVESNHNFYANGILVSNCLEIALPTSPFESFDDPNGEIALCTLAAFNLGKLESLDQLEDLADILVGALDCLLDYQTYPLEIAKRASMARRTLGVGVINNAYYLAKNGVRNSDGSSFSLTHRTFEAIQFYLMKASMELAKIKGACPKFHETKYSKGIMPADNYKPYLDEVCSEPLHMDWDTLRSDILEHGMRNSTLTALMPSETSSQISNATNGIEPPRGLISVKRSKDGVFKQVVPDIELYRDNYELLWDIPDNKGYLKAAGIMQKFVDQAISANTNYDPSKFPGNKVPIQLMLEDILLIYRLGMKTAYYHNTRDGASEDDDKSVEVEAVESSSCDGGACTI